MSDLGLVATGHVRNWGARSGCAAQLLTRVWRTTGPIRLATRIAASRLPARTTGPGEELQTLAWVGTGPSGSATWTRPSGGRGPARCPSPTYGFGGITRYTNAPNPSCPGAHRWYGPLDVILICTEMLSPTLSPVTSHSSRAFSPSTLGPPVVRPGYTVSRQVIVLPWGSLARQSKVTTSPTRRVCSVRTCGFSLLSVFCPSRMFPKPSVMLSTRG